MPEIFLFHERNKKEDKYKSFIEKMLFIMESQMVILNTDNGLKLVNKLDLQADIGDANMKRKELNSSDCFDLNLVREN